MSSLVIIAEPYFERRLDRVSEAIPARDPGQLGAGLELGYRPDEQPIAVDLA